MPAHKTSKSTQATQKKLAKNRASSPLSRLISTPNQTSNQKSTTKSATNLTTKSNMDSSKDSSQDNSQNPSSALIKSKLDFLSLLAKNLFITRRLKAFITDIFMLYTPILYIATYAVLGSAEAFRASQLSIFACFMIYAMIYAIFIAICGQTPGLKYANLKLNYLPKNNQKSTKSKNLDSKNLLDSTMSNPTPNFITRFFIAFVRVVLWALGVAFVFGILSPLFTRSRDFFYDSLTSTQIISINPHHIKI